MKENLNSDYKKNIKEILFDKPREFDLVLDILNQTVDNKNDIIVFKRRSTEISEKETKGLESFDVISKLKNKLNNDILKFIDELSPNDISLYFYLNNQDDIVFKLNDVIDGSLFEYIGDLKRGKPNGKGTAYYENGSIFKGNFKEGLWHGSGLFVDSEGKKYQSEWYNGAEKIQDDISKVLKLLENFSIEESIKEILSSANKYKDNSLLLKFISVDLGRISSRFTKLSDSGIFDRAIKVEPHEIQKIFVGYLNALNRGDEYFTITHLDFWSKRTLPHPRTFLDANVSISKKGIRGHRVIMLDKKFYDLTEEEKYMIRSHEEESKKIGGLNTRIVELPSTHDLDRVSNTAVFKTRSGLELMIEMLYETHPDEERYLSNIKVITSREIIESEFQRFSRWYEKGTEISKYISQHELFTYKVDFDRNSKAKELISCSKEEVTEDMWLELASHVHQEEDLIDFNAIELKSRWEKQMAAICINEEGIIGYVSLIDTFNKSRFEHILKRKGYDYEELPDIRIFEFQSGWTRANMRKKRISTLLRKRLMNNHRRAYSCFLCLTCRLSSSPVAARMNWHVVPWEKYRFITPLIGHFDYTEENYCTLKGKTMPTKGKITYNSRRIDLYNFDQIPPTVWDKHFFLWIEHDYILNELDEKISYMVKGDVNSWRDIVSSRHQEIRHIED